VILCGTSLRPPAALGPLPLVQLAGDTGCAGVCIDGGCQLGQVAQVALKSAWAKMRLQAIILPLPEERLTPGRRLPSLAAIDDPEERLAAIKLVRKAIEGTRDLGVGIFGLDFGRVLLDADEAVIRDHFARRELEEGEAGHRALERAVGERRARSAAHLDACRTSLDAAIRLAEQHDLQLAMRVAGTLWEIPSPREATQLMDEYGGAPVGVIHSPARLALLAAVGLGLSAERRERLHKAARLVEASDAVGLEYPLPAGVGEVDLSELRGAAAPVFLSGAADASTEEVQAARNLIEPV
jgi:hypothetical protein